jgi:hypothetical protein
MRTFSRLLAITTLILSLALAGITWAGAERGALEEAKAIAEKAAAVVKAEGIDKASALFTEPQGGFGDHHL